MNIFSGYELLWLFFCLFISGMDHGDGDGDFEAA